MKRFIKKYNILLILFILIILINSITKILKPTSVEIDDSLYIKELENRYNELLKLNNIDNTYKLDYFNSYIIYKDIYNYNSEITISGGSNYNFKVKDLVIYNNTLIGVISKVNKSTSIVRLLRNKDTLISVKINNEIGVLKYKNDSLVVENINNYGVISKGDKVYTSGIGNSLSNIFIGNITNIELDKKGIEKLIYIDNQININDINYVTVIRSS